MLKAIPWTQLAIAFTLLAAAYYLYIAWKYYRKEIKTYLGMDTIKRLLGIKGQKVKTTSVILTEEQFVEAYRKIEQLLYEVRQKLLPKAEGSKEKLLQLLALHLGNFQGMVVPAFRLAISRELIKIASQRNIALQEIELEEFWKNLITAYQASKDPSKRDL